MGDISPNFSRHEFGLSRAAAGAYGFSAADYPAEWVDDRLRPLCAVLETLRAELGGAAVNVIEAGGYRPREYDMERIRRGASGVSPNSQHHDGRAADIRVEGCTPEEVRAAVLALIEEGVAVGGVGIYDTFCHVDLGPPGRRWDRRTRRDAGD